MSKSPIIEVTNNLKAKRKRRSAQNARFIKRYMNSSLGYFGLSTPEQRAVFKKGYSFSNKKLHTQLKIWDKIWKKSLHAEVMTQALFFCESYKSDARCAALWGTVRSWAKRIENWGHSDSLSGVYAAILEQKPQQVLPVLKHWNASPSAWKRRLSIVSLLYYSQLRKKVLSYGTLEKMVRPLIRDNDIYVQKGVGWTLREMHNVYPRQTAAFIRRHALVLSPAAFTSSTEKWKKKDKEPLLKARKSGRRKMKKPGNFS